MELSDQIAALTVLERRVKEELQARKAAWKAQSRPRQRDAAMIGDAELGVVTMQKGRVSWKLTDEAAFVEWAQANAPHLVEYTAHVPEHHKATLKREPVTGEGEVIPGWEMIEGDPYPSVRLEKGADDVVARAVQSGALTYGELLEIEE